MVIVCGKAWVFTGLNDEGWRPLLKYHYGLDYYRRAGMAVCKTKDYIEVVNYIVKL